MDQHLTCACDRMNSPMYKGGPLTEYLINYIQWLNDSSLKTFSSFFFFYKHIWHKWMDDGPGKEKY